MMNEAKALVAFKNLDAELVELSKRLKLQDAISWPQEAQHDFLQSWRQARPKMPQPTYETVNHNDDIDALRSLQARAKAVSREHPVGAYLQDMAESYIGVAEMLANPGTPRFTEFATQLYGSPNARVGRSRRTAQA